MRRLLALFGALLLVAAACSDDSEGGDSGAGDTSTTASSATTDEAEAPDSGDTTALAITQVTFGGGGSVTITNVGAEIVDTTGYWVCNQPSYSELSGGDLAPGESVQVSATGLGGLPDVGAAAGLYSSNDFGSSEAIVDYVQWGDGGGRASVATDAGIWPGEGEVVAVEGAAIVADAGGSSAGDWSTG